MICAQVPGDALRLPRVRLHGDKFKDDPDNIKIIKAGETYLVPPGHIPVMNEDAVMVEFTQDTTYTNAEVQAKMKD